MSRACVAVIQSFTKVFLLSLVQPKIGVALCKQMFRVKKFEPLPTAFPLMKIACPNNKKKFGFYILYVLLTETPGQ